MMISSFASSFYLLFIFLIIYFSIVLSIVFTIRIFKTMTSTMTGIANSYKITYGVMGMVPINMVSRKIFATFQYVLSSCYSTVNTPKFISLQYFGFKRSKVSSVMKYSSVAWLTQAKSFMFCDLFTIFTFSRFVTSLNNWIFKSVVVYAHVPQYITKIEVIQP